MRSTTSPRRDPIHVDGQVGQLLVERGAAPGRGGPWRPRGSAPSSGRPSPAPTRRARVGTLGPQPHDQAGGPDAAPVVGVEDRAAGHRHHRGPSLVVGLTEATRPPRPGRPPRRPRRRSRAPSGRSGARSRRRCRGTARPSRAASRCPVVRLAGAHHPDEQDPGGRRAVRIRRPCEVGVPVADELGDRVATELAQRLAGQRPAPSWSRRPRPWPARR